MKTVTIFDYIKKSKAASKTEEDSFEKAIHYYVMNAENRKLGRVGQIYGKETEQKLSKLEIIEAPKHDFKNIAEARIWAKENITGTYHNKNTGEDISVSKTAIDKYLSESAIKKSVNLDTHLSALKQLPNLVKTSILRDSYPDRDNDVHIKEIQRLYGLINYKGINYPVKITVKVTYNDGSKLYSYEVMDIETLEKGAGGGINTSEENNNMRPPDVNILDRDGKDTTSLSNMQQNIEKSERMNIFQFLKSKTNKREECIIKGVSYYQVENGWIPNYVNSTGLLLVSNDILEKGGKRAVLGEIRKFADKEYVKTPKGWRPVPKRVRSAKSEPESKFKVGDTVYGKISGDSYVIMGFDGDWAYMTDGAVVLKERLLTEDELEKRFSRSKFKVGDTVYFVSDGLKAKITGVSDDEYEIVTDSGVTMTVEEEDITSTKPTSEEEPTDKEDDDILRIGKTIWIDGDVVNCFQKLYL